ncbi:ATP-binding protein [Catelliglobosispora koreensis]|uniref:ATP-binding protein n=1 Tax=Catelliglobosispora koreensis TaxID=129052 RepID=UPI0003A60B31|nr:ATP-binding protein [Catelliglobosispora koreensis]
MIDQHRDNINAIVINLARRSQLLVEQQQRLLTEMERQERDPGRLAELFRLDLLAARMRRNDENILVLAGGQARRRVAGGTSLGALVLAASAEIEQYQRIHRDITHDPLIAGNAVGDLTHLLAELFENATAFSAPGSPVRVVSRVDDEGQLLLEITDAGFGLSPAALADANAVLAEPPELGGTTSERMGLVVVSHLSARHQVRVRLRSSPSGTCACVALPGDLLTHEGAK